MTDLGPLNICNSCVIWSAFKNLALGAGSVPAALSGSWDSSCWIAFPSLNKGGCAYLMVA